MMRSVCESRSIMSSSFRRMSSWIVDSSSNWNPVPCSTKLVKFETSNFSCWIVSLALASYINPIQIHSKPRFNSYFFMTGIDEFPCFFYLFFEWCNCALIIFTELQSCLNFRCICDDFSVQFSTLFHESFFIVMWFPNNSEDLFVLNTESLQTPISNEALQDLESRSGTSLGSWIFTSWKSRSNSS